MPLRYVSDSASRVEFRYGAGNDSLTVYGYSFVMQGYTIFMSATQKDCVPIGQTAFGMVSGGTNV
jgi:hypothetical protein